MVTIMRGLYRFTQYILKNDGLVVDFVSRAVEEGDIEVSFFELTDLGKQESFLGQFRPVFLPETFPPCKVVTKPFTEGVARTDIF